MHYYPFHVADYISHTRHLTHIEDLAYRRLLDYCYLHESAIPSDTETAAKLVLMVDYKTEVAAVLNEFFELTECGWDHKRIKKQIKIYKNMKKGGKEGAKKRWGNQEVNTPPIAPPIATPLPPPIATKTNNQNQNQNQNYCIGGSIDPPRKKGTRLGIELLPNDWEQWARSEGLIDPVKTFARFRDYWIAVTGSKATKSDWFATWRNWVRRELENNTGGLTYAERNRIAIEQNAIKRHGRIDAKDF